jgi:hypothetical protein
MFPVRAAAMALAALLLPVSVSGVAHAAGPGLPSGKAETTAARCITVRVTGKKVAVRYDPEVDGRIVRWMHQGQREESCLIAIGRGESEDDRYAKCGKRGWDWYLVKGGYIPVTCAVRVGRA